MANATIKKTTHSEHTGGHCGSANNARYHGAGAVWQVWITGEDYYSTGFRQKWLAEAVVEWANTQALEAVSNCDIFMSFMNKNREVDAPYRAEVMKVCTQDIKEV